MNIMSRLDTAIIAVSVSAIANAWYATGERRNRSINALARSPPFATRRLPALFFFSILNIFVFYNSL